MDLWLLFVIPFLILLGPRFIRQITTHISGLRNKGEKKLIQSEILEIRKELSGLNQIDQFAKFARAQRKLRAATDKLNSLSRQDLEINFKYALVGQAFVWLLTVILSFRIVYQTYALALTYLGFDSKEQERAYL